jgi:thiamine-phosphate diphosphorylase
VHLGQSDGDPREARAQLGPNAQIGVTCHGSRHLAMEAGEAGADYVAFGAFHPTTTKTVEHLAEPVLLSWWSTLFAMPCVAIGGIGRRLEWRRGRCGQGIRRGARQALSRMRDWCYTDCTSSL